VSELIAPANLEPSTVIVIGLPLKLCEIETLRARATVGAIAAATMKRQAERNSIAQL
jgi:hypothetical protein